MPENSEKQFPNQRTEIWREEKVDRFKNNFADATSKIAKLLNEDDSSVSTKISEWYDPSRDRAYFVHGSAKIGESLRIFEVTWGVLTEDLDRHNIMLASDVTGKGIGTQINKIMEELGRNLGAKKLTLSAITNDRWHQKLLKEGFVQDPKHPDDVFKYL